MNIGIIGLGKLGTPVAVAISSKHHVIGCDINPKVMVKGKYPHLELGPKLENDFQEHLDKADIEFSSLERLVERCKIIFIAVQTPHQPRFEGITRLPDDRADFDYTYLISAVKSISHLVKKDQTIIVISTVLPGTMREHVLPLIEGKCNFVYNPYFIAMGTVMWDFLHPEFVLLGGDNTEVMQDFYYDYYSKNITVSMSIESAELTKCLYNTYITTKTIIANTILELCHKIPRCNCDVIVDTLSKATNRLMSPKYLNGGMSDGGSCFPPNQLVITRNGPRPIESIEPGDLVLSGDGYFHKVIRRWERQYCGKLIKFKTMGLPSTIVTPNHLVYVSHDLRKEYTTTMRGKIGVRKSGDPIAENLSEIEEIRANEIKIKDWTYWPVTKEIVDRPEHATDDYCHILGWYLSEGHINIKIGKKGTLQSGRITFSLNILEQKIAENLAILLMRNFPPKRVGAKARINKVKERGLTLKHSSVDLTKLLLKDCGKLAEHKFLPPWVLYGNENTICAILEGMFKGDGHLNKRRTTFTTISKNLAYGVFIMLERLNINSNLRCIEPRVSKKGQKHKRAYEIRIGNLVELRKLWPSINLGKIERKQKKIYTRYPLINGNRFHPIFNKEYIDYNGLVYNLWVEDTHNYVVPMGVVSNCHPRDNISMSWLANKLNLSYNLFDNIMMARENQTEWLAKLIMQHDLPKIILGKSFKPETNIATGSPAILLSNILKEYNCEFDHYDPHIDQYEFEYKKAVYFIATKHKCFLNIDFPEGSVIIDPHRYIKSKHGITVIPVGVNNG